MQNKEAFLEALRNGDQEEMNKVVSSELNSKAKEEVDSIEESVAENLLNERVDFDMVFKAVAKHFDVDPEDVDSLDTDKKKEVYNMVDKCWDEDNDVVPDACPIDIGESTNISEAKKKNYNVYGHDKMAELIGKETGKQMTGLEMVRQDADTNEWLEQAGAPFRIKKKSQPAANITDKSQTKYEITYDTSYDKEMKQSYHQSPVKKRDVIESVNEITDYNATSLHGSGGTVDGPSKSKQSAAANAATKMMSMQATNFNQMMSDVYSTDPDRARAFQDMIANNPGESTMKKIATDMMDNSDLAKVMKNYLGDYEKNVDIGTGDMDGKA